jgi:hypothetical protein
VFKSRSRLCTIMTHTRSPKWGCEWTGFRGEKCIRVIHIQTPHSRTDLA